MHNSTKIKLFRILLRISYWPSLLLVYPFARLKKKSTASIFFFFDRYSLGGAQRIHLDILKAMPEIPKDVFFTRLSPNRAFREEFYHSPATSCRDIHFWCDNLFFRLFTVHYLCFYLNRHRRCTVLGANSTFFYDMLPFLRKDTRRIELLHNFTFGKKGMEFFGLASYHSLDFRIIYDEFTRENLRKQYEEYGIEKRWEDRILFIEPGVDIPKEKIRQFEDPLKIVCAGRGGAQKRIHLINRIAEECLNRSLPVEFHFAGTLLEELSPEVKSYSVIHGEVRDPGKMGEILSFCDIALLTSAYEGFPMFIKEAMAHGCIPVATALPGNRMHLASNENSLLIEAVADENSVVIEGLEYIKALLRDRALCHKLSHEAYRYAAAHFTRDIFNMKYRELLLSR